MTIRHIRTFYEVCRLGGITRAAESLCVAQPSVSQAVSELESYYGVPLFERVGRKLVLTPEGERLRGVAAEAVAAFDQFEQAALSAPLTPSVRVGASMTAGKNVVPRLIRALQLRIPGADCRVEVDSTEEILHAILQGALDFAVVEGEIRGDVEAQRWSADRLAAVCAPDEPFPSSVAAGGLAALPLLLRKTGSASRDLLESALSAAGLATKPLMQSASNSALIAAAAGGLGVAVLPFALVEGHISRGELREIALAELNLNRSWFVIWRRGKNFSAAQRAALDICLKKEF